MFSIQFLRTITTKWTACYAFLYSTISKNFKSKDHLFLQMNLQCHTITYTAFPNDRDNWQCMTCAWGQLMQTGIRLSWSESIRTHWRTNAPEDRTHKIIEINDIAHIRHRAVGQMIGINQADATAKEKDHTLPNLHHRTGENQDGKDNNGKAGMEVIVKPIQRLIWAFGKSKPIKRFLYMLVEDVIIAETTALIFSGHCMLHGVLELSTCLNLCIKSTMN